MKGDGYPSADAMFQRLEELAAGGNPAAVASVQEELIRLHRLWSREDLMTRYGAPTSIGGGERGLTMSYTRLNGTNQYETVNFVTIEDVVTQAWGTLGK